jgi:glycosyltransferase involved in cell wall biosynthesis
MRIAQVTPYFHPHIGGVESNVYNISKNLLKLGHEITVFTAQYDKKLPRQDELDGLKIVRSKELTNLFTTPVTPSLNADLLADTWDIVHTHAPPPLSSYYVAKAKNKGHFPTVMTYHCDPEIPVRGGGLITSMYRSIFGNYTLRRMDLVLAETETYAATSRAIWNSHAKVIPPGVDTDRFNPKNNGQTIRERFGLGSSKVVMFVGRLTFHKGVNHLIDAAGLYRDAKYLIVGSGPEEARLKSLAAASPNAKNIIFTGKASAEDLPHYYAACDLLVLPSVSRLEAFGLVMLEAMASGRPVITSDMPGMREVVVDGVDGLLAEPLDAHDISEKIRILLEDDEKRKQFGANGRSKVEERFTWARVTKMTEDAYKRVLQRKEKHHKT